MKFTSFCALASLTLSTLGVDVTTLRMDATSLANSITTFEDKVSSFPSGIGLGSVVAAQQIVSTSAQVVMAANSFIRDAVTLTEPVPESDGLEIVRFLDTAAQVYIRAMRALQARKDAIDALPSLGPVNAALAVRQALKLVNRVANRFKATLAQYAFTGAALDEWIAAADRVIDEQVATIDLFASG
ncbi:hypothetical protein DXG01_010405 [Tephrocybe rancida]|nr:hypothetical protein DXG01_010405 [Tephrocybe rancida]